MIFFRNKKGQEAAEFNMVTLGKIIMLSLVLLVLGAFVYYIVSGFVGENVPYKTEASFSLISSMIQRSYEFDIDQRRVTSVHPEYQLIYGSEDFFNKKPFETKKCRSKSCLCIFSLKKQRIVKCDKYDFPVSMNAHISDSTGSKKVSSCVSFDMNKCDPTVNSRFSILNIKTSKENNGVNLDFYSNSVFLEDGS